MKRTPALARLEQRLARDPCAILSATEVRLLDGEVRRALLASFPGIEPHLSRSEDMTRWQALGARCRQAPGARGIRDISVTSGIPQYRVRAIESGHLSEVRADLARRYFQFLGIETWVTRWCHANRELAARVGLMDPAPRRRRAPRADDHRHGK
jgi:hypothetical protein